MSTLITGNENDTRSGIQTSVEKKKTGGLKAPLIYSLI